MRPSIIGSLILVLVATYLILRLSKRANSERYQVKPKNKWRLLSEGKDPTDD
jgi:hypothetical protein